MAAFPSVTDLAAASPEAVREAWAGLGYYRRAAALHAAARTMVADATTATGDGDSQNEAVADLPRTIDGLRALPGVGAYTAGAIAAIAYGLPAAAVDGNVARVFARLRPPADVEDTAGAAVPPVSAAAVATAATRHATIHATALVAGTGGGADEDDPGDLAQALMELGATICTPLAPACGTCPVRAWCGGAAEAAAAERRALAAVVAAAGGGATATDALGAPVAEVVHLFSHIRQTLLVHRLHVEGDTLAMAATAAAAVASTTTAAAAQVPPREGRWVTRDGLAAAAVSTGMRKAFAAAVAAVDDG
ncbi:hypothetical protein MMPV_003061 [Pyropia vietnamensis]